MKRIILASTLGVVALAGGVAAYASQHGGPMGRMDANSDGAISRAEVTAQVDKHFTRMDADGDGAITTEDRATRMEARGERRFERFDANSDGAISRAEWDARQDARAERREHRGHRGGKMRGLRAHLTAADANKDGMVTKAEAQAGALALFGRFDANQDGNLSAAEREAAHAAFRVRRAS